MGSFKTLSWNITEDGRIGQSLYNNSLPVGILEAIFAAKLVVIVIKKNLASSINIVITSSTVGDPGTFS